MGDPEALELCLEGDLSPSVPGRVDAPVVCEQGGRHPVTKRGGAEHAHDVDRFCHNDGLRGDTKPGVVVDEVDDLELCSIARRK